MITKLYDFIIKVSKPIVTFIGKIHWPFSRKKVTGYHYFLLRDLIEVGTVLLTKTEGEFSNYINPVSKDIKHGALYIGYVDGIPTVIEALGKGVRYTDLVTFLTTKDRVIGLKPSFLNDADRAAISNEAVKLIGIPYDYYFKSQNKNLYCFELLATLFESVKPSIVLKKEEIVKNYFIYDESTFLNDNRFMRLFDTKDLTNE